MPHRGHHAHENLVKGDGLYPAFEFLRHHLAFGFSSFSPLSLFGPLIPLNWLNWHNRLNGLNFP
jgi:hypothetical protein